MRAALALVLVAACGNDAPAPPPADPLLRSVPKPVPPGPYRVTYTCPGNQQRIDLGAQTRSTIANGSPEAAVGPISGTMVAMVTDAVTKVLAGGPYRAEPGPCTLSIETAGGPVFTIEKSGHAEQDAVSGLVRAFVP